MSARTANVSRDTFETQITVAINLDGTGQTHFETGVPFLDHMLDQIGRHGLIDLNIVANGDHEIDDHTVEDIGIILGQAFSAVLGDKKGIVRYGHHIIETIFKAFGRALRMAIAHDPRMAGIMPSTKGSL